MNVLDGGRGDRRKVGVGWGLYEKSVRQGGQTLPTLEPHMNLSVAARYRGTPSEPPLTAWYVDSAALSQKGSMVSAGLAHRKSPTNASVSVCGQRDGTVYFSHCLIVSLLFTPKFTGKGPVFFMCLSGGSKTYCDYGHFLKNIFIYLLSRVLVVEYEIWFPAQGSNQAPCSGSTESQPMDHQGRPTEAIFDDQGRNTKNFEG